MSLLVIGSIALDSIETPFGKVDDTVGGSAVYAAAAASLLTPVQVVGVVGEDYPLKDLEFLRQRKVDLSGLSIERGKTFRWGGRYGANMNQRDTLFTELGVFAEFDPVIPEAFRDTSMVFLGNIHPEIQLRVVEQIRSPRLVAADTMNFWIHGERAALHKLLKKVNLLLVNEEEARDLSGEYNLLKAARAIHALGPSYVVIKRGEYGSSLFFAHDEMTQVFLAPAFPLEHVSDPTGAGDTFAGGMMGALCQNPEISGAKMRRSMIVGSAIASFAVEDFGTNRIKTITLDEILARCEAFQGLTSF